MTYPLKTNIYAKNLRKKGFSVKEIAKKLGPSQSTISLWVRNIVLNKTAEKRLERRIILARNKSIDRWKLKREKIWCEAKKNAERNLLKIKINKNLSKILCSFLFWAEGTKNVNYLSIINSDPKLIAVFLRLLRFSFPIDEDKFRAMIHVHEYHNERLIKKFWSKITNIPLSQFSASYQKPHTKKRKRPGYKGSLRIRYYNVKISRELYAIYETFAEKGV